MEWMGHADIQTTMIYETTMIYAHYYPSNRSRKPKCR